MDKTQEVLQKYGKTMAICALVLLVIFGLWYCFRDVSDNGRTINTIRDDIQRARSGQSKASSATDTIERGLTDSAKSVEELRNEVGRATGAIDSAAERNQDIKGIVDRNGQRITEGRTILEQVRTQTRPSGTSK